ncbi:MAG: hypothetical protein PHI31_14035 [Desulfuromonadaceae bacterium]|nr:hypothetical protein [Desulfuromonadaceae bacterium]
MNNEEYYCPLCGNKPVSSFVPCRVIERPICKDCDSIIRQFFQNEYDKRSDTPNVMENLYDYSGISQKECKDIYQKEQMVTLLLSFRDGINYYDESGEIWDFRTLKLLLYQFDELSEAGSFLREQR